MTLAFAFIGVVLVGTAGGMQQEDSLNPVSYKSALSSHPPTCRRGDVRVPRMLVQRVGTQHRLGRYLTSC